MRPFAFTQFPSRRSLWGLLAALAAVLCLTLAAGLAEAQESEQDPATVEAVKIVSDAGDDDTYVLDDVIRIRVTFSAAVDVTGTPRLKIDMDQAAWGEKWAKYTSGSGSASLIFSHTVVQPNLSTQGIAVLANSLELNGGTIGWGSVAADLSHDRLRHSPKHKVDWRRSPGAPTVTDVAISSDAGGDGTYALGETIRITLSFSEAVEVTGTPQVAIDMDRGAWGRKQASYESGTGTASLTFAHTVVEPNLSTQGIAVLANTLALNGGTIRSASSQTNAGLAHRRLNHDSDHKVDWRLAPQTDAACELIAPSSVTGLGIARGAVISWTVPEGLPEACEAIGVTVGATNSEGLSLEVRLDDPQARRHVLRGLEPGEYRFHARMEYAEGPSKRIVPRQGNTVPAICNVSLTVKPHDRNAISGRWTHAVDTPTGCVAGPHIEYQYKRSSDDYFMEYGQYPSQQQMDPGLPSFIAYGLRPYVGYDFRVVAVDAAGQQHTSNVASATIVSDNPSATADPNSPGNVRVHADSSSGAFVQWGLPEIGSGRTLSAYVVEWRSGTAPAMTTVVDDSGDGEGFFQGRRFRITGLTNGEPYTVRVAARTYLTGDTGMTTSDAWSLPAPRIVAWSEPTQVWFVPGSPVHSSSGRVFMTADSNKRLTTSIICSVSSDGGAIDRINCPAGTFVSLEADGEIRVFAEATHDGVVTTSPTSIGSSGGPAGGFGVYASGGDGELLVEWGSATTGLALGTLDAYIVQHRLQNTDGTWPDWPTGEVKAASDHTHTFTGLTNGTWQVRVRGRTDGDDGDPGTTDTARLGFTSNVVTVTLASDNDEAPGEFANVRVTPGDSQSLVVEWQPPSGGALVHAYQVRYRPKSAGASYTESEMLYPPQTRSLCGSYDGCENPRRYEITGLTGGQDYDVAIRAFNANGAGEWVYTLTQNIPND